MRAFCSLSIEVGFFLILTTNSFGKGINKLKNGLWSFVYEKNRRDILDNYHIIPNEERKFIKSELLRVKTKMITICIGKVRPIHDDISGLHKQLPLFRQLTKRHRISVFFSTSGNWQNFFFL